MIKTLLSFGHGFSARALARRLIADGWTVHGTTRSAEKAEAIRETGVIPHLFPDPAGRDGVLAALESATHILMSPAPNDGGDPVLAELGPQIAAKSSSLDWAGYLSTTGVYGDHDGDWVGEDDPLTATTKRGRMRVAAEAEWRAIPDLPIHIFRLAGIYGPGRGPFEKVRAGTARRIIKPGQVFSRIHVEDIAQVLQASIERPNPGTAYNVCDNDPAPPQDVLAYAAELLGLPPPPEVPFDEADMSPMARSFYSDSKRVRNDRIRNELGVELLYPDYRSGLARLLAEEQE
ncbi:SDR family oxidoreductase [Chachezhania antarctica]|uniref:SDR family oxidoreductase n=1 Tax=Chachezhania antarctica TaxID=2340860 RepID=UPI000EB07009|nr:SDR family oxidoreductase [Chachezhania antarctica]